MQINLWHTWLYVTVYGCVLERLNALWLYVTLFQILFTTYHLLYVYAGWLVTHVNTVSRGHSLSEISYDHDFSSECYVSCRCLKFKMLWTVVIQLYCEMDKNVQFSCINIQNDRLWFGYTLGVIWPWNLFIHYVFVSCHIGFCFSTSMRACMHMSSDIATGNAPSFIVA
jgi:hypothetical protein